MLVNCVAYADGRKIADIREEQISDYLAQPGTFVWVALNFEHMPELKWMFGYPISLALMAGIDFYLFRRFRRAGWL